MNNGNNGIPPLPQSLPPQQAIRVPVFRLAQSDYGYTGAGIAVRTNEAGQIEVAIVLNGVRVSPLGEITQLPIVIQEIGKTSAENIVFALDSEWQKKNAVVKPAD